MPGRLARRPDRGLVGGPAEGRADLHLLRKTTLQYARAGEDVNRAVAADARLGESVMMTSNVKETDEQSRQASSRTFARVLASRPSWPDAAATRSLGTTTPRGG